MLLAFAACVGAKTGEVCFLFGSSKPAMDPLQLSQGHPGKIRPHCPAELPVGEPGPSGRRPCELNEIEQLREEIRLQDSE